jgi:hypothetical protein
MIPACLKTRFARLALLAALLTVAVQGCTTLRQIAALRAVDFALGRLHGVRIAGIVLDRLQGGRDLRPEDMLQIAQAVARGRVPLELMLDVEAHNPRDSEVSARLVKMAWGFWLRDRETVRGVVDRDVLVAPGETVTVAVPVELDLYRFFSDDAGELRDLARALSDDRRTAEWVKLAIRPTLTTPLGPVEVGEITLRPGERRTVQVAGLP